MKVYVVTDGCYSDYHIEKVFLDEAKANEFASFAGYEVEVYDVANEFQIGHEIVVTYIVRPNGNNSISYFTNKYISEERFLAETTIKSFPYWASDETPKKEIGFMLTIKRFIPCENFDEELYSKKYKKVAYDLAAIVIQKFNEGAYIEDINKMFKKSPIILQE